MHCLKARDSGCINGADISSYLIPCIWGVLLGKSHLLMHTSHTISEDIVPRNEVLVAHMMMKMF